MPKFNFELPVPLDSEKAFTKIKGFLSGQNDFKKFDPNVTCTFDEATKSAKLSGSQFKANLTVKPTAETCKVDITVEVPLTLALFKGKIQETIEKNLKKILS